MSSRSVEAAPAAPPLKRSNKRAFLRIGGSVLILGLVLWMLPFDELVKSLSNVPVQMWIASLGIYMCLHLIGVWKWRMVINAAGADITFADTLRCYYYGLFGNLFLPSIVGGDLIRAGLAFRLARSKSGVLMGSVVDRMIDTLGLATVAGMGALLVPTALDADTRRVFWVFGGLMAAGLVGLLAAVRVVGARRFPFKIRRKLVKVRRSVRTLIDRPGVLLASFFGVIVLQTLLVVLNVWLGEAIGIQAPFVVWLFVWPLSKIAAMLPITQGGIGVREAAFAALFAPFGVSAHEAVAASLVFNAVVYAGGLAGGVLSGVMGRFESPRAASA